MKNHEIEQLKRECDRLKSEVSELRDGLRVIAKAVGLKEGWYGYSDLLGMSIRHTFHSTGPTIADQVELLKDHLKVDIVEVPAVPAKHVVRRKINV